MTSLSLALPGAHDGWVCLTAVELGKYSTAKEQGLSKAAARRFRALGGSEQCHCPWSECFISRKRGKDKNKADPSPCGEDLVPPGVLSQKDQVLDPCRPQQGWALC